MSSTAYPDFVSTTTAPGDETGILAVTSTSGYRAGAIAYLRGAAGSPAAQRCRISEVVDATHVGVVFLPEDINDVKLRTGAVLYPSYMRSDCTAYDTGSTLSQPAQIVADIAPLL